MKDRLIAWLWAELRPHVDAAIDAAAAKLAQTVRAELARERAELAKQQQERPQRRFIGQ